MSQEIDASEFVLQHNLCCPNQPQYFNQTRNMDMRLNFYILDLAFSPEFQTLLLQHSPMKNIRLSVNLNCQMHCCNFNCCNFSYLESSIPLQNIFLNWNPTKPLEIEDSFCISSTIFVLFVEQFSSVLSTSLFPFSSDFVVVSLLD